MKLGRFIRELLNNKKAVWGVVTKQEEVYAELRKRRPGEEPHALLAQVWLSRVSTYGTMPLDSHSLRLKALADTYLFACLPEGKNARALGLYFAYKEAPEVVARVPEMYEEYTLLVTPLQDAVDSGEIRRLYATRNPSMAAQGGDAPGGIQPAQGRQL